MKVEKRKKIARPKIIWKKTITRNLRKLKFEKEQANNKKSLREKNSGRNGKKIITIFYSIIIKN